MVNRNLGRKWLKRKYITIQHFFVLKGLTSTNSYISSKLFTYKLSTKIMGARGTIYMVSSALIGTLPPFFVFSSITVAGTMNVQSCACKVARCEAYKMCCLRCGCSCDDRTAHSNRYRGPGKQSTGKECNASSNLQPEKTVPPTRESPRGSQRNSVSATATMIHLQRARKLIQL